MRANKNAPQAKNPPRPSTRRSLAGDSRRARDDLRGYCRRADRFPHREPWDDLLRRGIFRDVCFLIEPQIPRHARTKNAVETPRVIDPIVLIIAVRNRVAMRVAAEISSKRQTAHLSFGFRWCDGHQGSFLSFRPVQSNIGGCDEGVVNLDGWGTQELSSWRGHHQRNRLQKIGVCEQEELIIKL